MMLRLATVFSGIGAIEHALMRLGVEHEIVFASDNGGIPVFSKKIETTDNAIQDEIMNLEKKLTELSLEDSEYYIDLVFNRLKQIKEDFKTIIQNIKTFLNQNDVNFELESPIEVFNNLKDQKEKQELFSQSKYKRIRKDLNDIVSDLNQLHEVIGITELKFKLNQISSYEEKKRIVDVLYEGQQKVNYVKKSYMANYNIGNEKFHYDINFIDGTQYTGKVDLFVGGSPCQSFSMVGKRRGLDDTRGTLFYDYARLIDEIKPKMFIYENVKGLLSHDGGNTWMVMKEVFEDLGYDWKFETLNAKDYGVPQNRERIFVVGFRKDLKLNKEFSFPKPIKLNTVMKDYLIDNVSGKYYLPEKGVDFVTSEKNLNKRYTQIDGDIQLCQKANQQFNWHGDFVFVEAKDRDELMDDLEKYFLSEKVKKYVLASGTKNFYSKPEINLDIARPLLQTMHKMHRAGVDNYVETEGRLRKLTPRECLRLMGFCDSFQIVVSDTQMYRQAGNSIVVDVLMHILNEIFDVIK